MCTPTEYPPSHDALAGVATEIRLAMSSLNSEPWPIPPDPDEEWGGSRWLSNRDRNVQHAMEHLHAAIAAYQAYQISEVDSLRRHFFPDT